MSYHIPKERIMWVTGVRALNYESAQERYDEIFLCAETKAALRRAMRKYVYTEPDEGLFRRVRIVEAKPPTGQ